MRQRLCRRSRREIERGGIVLRGRSLDGKRKEERLTIRSSLESTVSETSERSGVSS